MTECLKILKRASVDALRQKADENTERYQLAERPDWDSIIGGDPESNLMSTKVEICGDISDCFRDDDLTRKDGETDRIFANRTAEREAEHCQIIYRTLKNLTPQQATDERLWVYLTHYIFWEYSCARWPYIKTVSNHFFADSLRVIVRDNAISRLWWMGHVCNKVDECSQLDALRALLLQQDVRKEIMERSAFCQSPAILDTLMKFMVKSYQGNQYLHERGNFRLLCKHLNRVGGVTVLEAMSTSDLDNVVMRIIENDLKIDPEFPNNS